jgi:hypothetical protein
MGMGVVRIAQAAGSKMSNLTISTHCLIPLLISSHLILLFIPSVHNT